MPQMHFSNVDEAYLITKHKLQKMPFYTCSIWLFP